MQIGRPLLACRLRLRSLCMICDLLLPLQLYHTIGDDARKDWVEAGSEAALASGKAAASTAIKP